ncbi:MAG: CAP domain-containing protein, partial [Chloroflexota bacterium]
MHKTTIGIILLIFIIPLMQLPGMTAFATEDEIYPQPITSSKTQQSNRAIVVSVEATTTIINFEASHFIFIPSISTAVEESDDPFMSEEEIAVINIVNEERAKVGCGAVAANPYLREAAFLHSQDMGVNNYFDHTGLNGSRFWERAEDAGYQGFAAGENIAAGQRTPESVMNGWMNSAGHRANLLNCNHTEIGVGYYYGSGSTYRHYWTQIFGR